MKATELESEFGGERLYDVYIKSMHLKYIGHFSSSKIFPPPTETARYLRRS
jgi:hypothetical protein